MKRMVICIFAVLATIGFGGAQEKGYEYLNQAPPGDTPEEFALAARPGNTPSDRIAISSDGREIYYTEITGDWSRYGIRSYRFADGAWTGPNDLFDGFLGPALSPDGSTMFFEKYNEGMTSWYAARRGSGWSEPAPARFLNDPAEKHYLQRTVDGRYYASSRNSDGGLGGMDIGTIADDGKTLRSLGSPVDSSGNEGDFYIAPDGTFIIFASPQRDGMGGADLFASFRARSGSWTDPINLGSPINTSGWEFGPYVTADRKYLFYSSMTGSADLHINWIRFDSTLADIKRRAGE